MGGGKPKVYNLPFQQQQTASYGPVGYGSGPEVQAFLDEPINVDPGVGRRTDLAEQEASNYWDSAFQSGVPKWIRDTQRQSQQRQIRSQGAYESQQAESQNAALRLARRERLLPQIMQLGGASSGYNSQLYEPRRSPLWDVLQGFATGAGSALTGGIGRK